MPTTATAAKATKTHSGTTSHSPLHFLDKSTERPQLSRPQTKMQQVCSLSHFFFYVWGNISWPYDPGFFSFKQKILHFSEQTFKLPKTEHYELEVWNQQEATTSVSPRHSNNNLSPPVSIVIIEQDWDKKPVSFTKAERIYHDQIDVLIAIRRTRWWPKLLMTWLRTKSI